MAGPGSEMEISWILSDAHGHLGEKGERKEREEAKILSLLCATSPEEARMLTGEKGVWSSEKGELGQEAWYLIPTCGIHPWYADRYELKDMKQWMDLCPIIGEIGMDSVWCSVDLKVQEAIFRQQLELAWKQNKPVILHTKGQEKEIGNIIGEYPNRYLVHWYSCDLHLEKYLEQDCYVSIGPDVWWNLWVRQVAQRIPTDRLLIETDGLNGVKWAYEEGMKACSDKIADKLEICSQGECVRESLVNTLKTVAEIRGISPKELGRQIKDNLLRFMDGSN